MEIIKGELEEYFEVGIMFTDRIFTVYNENEALSLVLKDSSLPKIKKTIMKLLPMVSRFVDLPAAAESVAAVARLVLCERDEAERLNNFNLRFVLGGKGGYFFKGYY